MASARQIQQQTSFNLPVGQNENKLAALPVAEADSHNASIDSESPPSACFHEHVRTSTRRRRRRSAVDLSDLTSELGAMLSRRRAPRQISGPIALSAAAPLPNGGGGRGGGAGRAERARNTARLMSLQMLRGMFCGGKCRSHGLEVFYRCKFGAFALGWTGLWFAVRLTSV